MSIRILLAARIALVITNGAALSMATPAYTAAQWVYLGRSPTICSTPFKPYSGLTFHSQAQWRILWSTAPGQFGAATFAGTPNPVTSEEGTKIWEDPSANVTCWIKVYQNGVQKEYIYDWHVEGYGGTVRNCGGGGGIGGVPPARSDLASVSGPDYDPYDPFDSLDAMITSSCSPDGSGDHDDPDGSCHDEYLYIEVSNDGGVSWTGWWQGWVTVCG